MTMDVVKTESSFESAGRYTLREPAARIAVKTWSPVGVGADCAPRGILQINHGMQEYVDRYDSFARAAAAQGWLVVGMDFIGHGDSAAGISELGFTGVRVPGGRNPFIEDMHSLRSLTQAQWPGVPYVMFGHSMGSFVLRAYLGLHGAGLAAAVISGTGTMPAGMVVAAKILLGLMQVNHLPDYRSRLFSNLSIGAYNKPFSKNGGPRTEVDWLSRDTEQVDRYVADPRCGGVFTLAADRELMDSIGRANAVRSFAHTPHDLPILLLSGEQDPVGANGKGVRAVAQAYSRAGVRDLSLKLYAGARHEMLNELNRAEVVADILAWLDQRVAA